MPLPKTHVTGAFLIFAATLTLVVWRPRGLGIGWSAMAGAALALATGVVRFAEVGTVWHIVWDPTATFVALIIISLILDEAGFFRWSALYIARFARGRAKRLFPLLILLTACTSAFFANDGAVLILTPIATATLAMLGFSRSAVLAFVFAIGFAADTTSVPLVISNLVNILSADYFSIPFGRYAGVMVPVDVMAVLSTLALLWLYFRRGLPGRFEPSTLPAPAEAIRDPLVFKAGLPVLGLVLGVYFFTAGSYLPVSAVTGVGAVTLLMIAGRWYRGGEGGRIPVARVLRQAPWQIVFFSVGMYVVVYGLRDAGLTAWLAGILTTLAGQGVVVATVGTGFLAAALSSVTNNMPAVLLMALAAGHAHGGEPDVHRAMIYANIIGCDIGSKLTPLGSLATLLWLHLLNRRGIHVGWGTYMRITGVLTPPVLLVTLLALAGGFSPLV